MASRGKSQVVGMSVNRNAYMARNCKKTNKLILEDNILKIW